MSCSRLEALAFLALGLAAAGLAGCGPCVSFTLLKGEHFEPSVVRLGFRLETCGGEPLADREANDFVIEEDGHSISSYESDQQIVSDPKEFRIATVLLLDMSGSILNSGSLPKLQEAAEVFAQRIGGGQEVAIYTFDGREELQRLADFSADVAVLDRAVESLGRYKVVDKSTNFNGAVIHGLELLEVELEKAAKKGTLFAGSLIIFTDGTDHAARVDAGKAMAAARSSKFDVFTVGLGGEVDKDQLANIGKSGFFYAENAASLNQAFGLLAEKLLSRARSYYLLAYCSPKRAGAHGLNLSLKDSWGSLNYQFDAANFRGGCSPELFIRHEGKAKSQPLTNGKPLSKCQRNFDCSLGQVCRHGQCMLAACKCQSDSCAKPGEFCATKDGNPAETCSLAACEDDNDCLLVGNCDRSPGNRLYKCENQKCVPE